MNDADFEMLAAQGAGAYEAWLRSQALGHAIRWRAGRDLGTTMLIANKIYDYIKGEVSGQPNLHSQE